jgi:hypothetical protein
VVGPGGKKLKGHLLVIKRNERKEVPSRHHIGVVVVGTGLWCGERRFKRRGTQGRLRKLNRVIFETLTLKKNCCTRARANVVVLELEKLERRA